MSDMIAYCGLDCGECNAYETTRTRDLEKKKQMARQWSDGTKVEFTPEDIDCDGCWSNRISGWCRKICKIRPCAEQRKVKTCSHCSEYPCGKLGEFLANEPTAKQNLESIRKTLQP